MLFLFGYHSQRYKTPVRKKWRQKILSILFDLGSEANYILLFKHSLILTTQINYELCLDFERKLMPQLRA
jgi:hypothetical protein